MVGATLAVAHIAVAYPAVAHLAITLQDNKARHVLSLMNVGRLSTAIGKLFFHVLGLSTAIGKLFFHVLRLSTAIGNLFFHVLRLSDAIGYTYTDCPIVGYLNLTGCSNLLGCEIGCILTDCSNLLGIKSLCRNKNINLINTYNYEKDFNCLFKKLS
jgi:hypothetical protein